MIAAAAIRSKRWLHPDGGGDEIKTVAREISRQRRESDCNGDGDKTRCWPIATVMYCSSSACRCSCLTERKEARRRTSLWSPLFVNPRFSKPCVQSAKVAGFSPLVVDCCEPIGWREAGAKKEKGMENTQLVFSLPIDMKFSKSPDQLSTVSGVAN